MLGLLFIFGFNLRPEFEYIYPTETNKKQINPLNAKFVVAILSATSGASLTLAMHWNKRNRDEL